MVNGRRSAWQAVLLCTLAGLVLPLAGAAASAAPPKRVVISFTDTPTAASGGATNDTTARFAWTATPAAATFTCAVDGGRGKSCASPLNLTALRAGTHSLTVRGSASGFKAGTSRWSWTIDLTAPPAPSVSTPVSPNNLSLVSLTITDTATDLRSPDPFRCALDGNAFTDCASPYDVPVATDGRHTVTVKAVDRVGNVSKGTTVDWVTDTLINPPFVITGPPPLTTSSSADFTFGSDEPGVTFTCALDSGPAVSCDSGTQSYTGLASSPAGTDHTFAVEATDAAGNVADSAPYTWTVQDGPPVVGPVATITTPTTLTGPATVTFDKNVSGVDGTSVLLETSLGSAVTTSMVCKNASSSVVGCASGNVRSVALKPAKPLLPGQHYLAVVNPVGAMLVNDGAGNFAAGTAQAFRGALKQSESSPAATYAWQTVRTAKARGGSFLQERSAGASVSYRFSGRSITWVTVTGPRYGRADVLVDGKRKASFNNYAAKTRYGTARTIKGLRSGSHTVKVVAKGKKGSKKASDTLVAVDAFKVGKKLVASPKVRVTWRRVSATAADGKAYAAATLRSESVSLRFRGTGVAWRTVTGPTSGKVAVYVDGVKKAVVDNWSAQTIYRVDRKVTGLADATHILKLVVTGTKNTKSTGTTVALDSWTVS